MQIEAVIVFIILSTHSRIHFCGLSNLQNIFRAKNHRHKIRPISLELLSMAETANCRITVAVLLFLCQKVLKARYFLVQVQYGQLPVLTVCFDNCSLFVVAKNILCKFAYICSKKDCFHWFRTFLTWACCSVHVGCYWFITRCFISTDIVYKNLAI